MERRPYRRKVQFYETDGMGIVYHGNYIHWMEEAHTDFMEQLGCGYETLVDAGIDIALTDVSCHNRSMTRFGEHVDVFLSITALSPARLALAYRMVDVETGTLRCEGESRHFFYDRKKGRPAALKRLRPELYQRFEALAGKEGAWKSEM